jgi:hypothetical protein
MQAELFNEVLKWVHMTWRKIDAEGADARTVERRYAVLRDFFKAARNAWGDAWGHPKYQATKSVALKAQVRVCAELAADDAEPAEDRDRRWTQRLAPWNELVSDFRDDGFYERFAAKGQVERVGKIQRVLAAKIGL